MGNAKDDRPGLSCMPHDAESHFMGCIFLDCPGLYLHGPCSGKVRVGDFEWKVS